MNTKVVGILVVLAAVVSIAAFIATQRGRTTSSPSTSPSSTTNAPVFPGIAERVDEITSIVIQRAEQTFRLTRSPSDRSQWILPDKADYPVNIDAVRNLLVGLSDLRILEARTSRSDQYGKLGVDEPVAPPPDSSGAPLPQSTRVTLLDGTNQPIAAIIVGNTRSSSSPELFVRVAGSAQSLLVSGRVDVPRDPVGWLRNGLVNIDRARFQSLEILHPDGTSVRVVRASQADPFVLAEIPAGKSLKDPGTPEAMVNAFSKLNFQDVAAASSLNLPAPTASPTTPPTPVPSNSGDGTITPGPTMLLRTFDGLIVRVTSASKNARVWWRFAATVDEAIPSKVTPPPTDSPNAPAAAGTLQALTEEATRLNSAWSGFVFSPVDWKSRSLNQTAAELLADVPAQAPVQPAP